MSERKIPGADRAAPGDRNIIDRGTDDANVTAEGAEDKARREHASRMFKWLDELCVDRGLSNFAVRLGSLIRNRVSRQTGYATASQIWFAKALGIYKKPATKNQDDGTRRIRRGVAELVKRGRLQKGPGKRLTPIVRGDATWPVWKEKQVSGASAPPEQNRTQESGSADSTPDPPGGQTGHRSPENRTQESGKPDTGVRRNHCSESLLVQTTEALSGAAKDSKQEEEQEKNLQRAAEILGVELTNKRRERWVQDLEEQSKKGLDFRIDVEPQMLSSVLTNLRKDPPEVLEVTTLRYFDKAALKWIKSVEKYPEYRAEPAHFSAGMWAEIQEVRSRISADERHASSQRERHACRMLHGAAYPKAPSLAWPAIWWRDQYRGLKEFKLDAMVAALERARDAGVVPTDPEALKGAGKGLRPLIERFLEPPVSLPG